MTKTLTDLTVTKVKRLSSLYLLLELSLPKNIKIQPGQFANLKIPNNKNIFLRRPFSIHDVEKQTIKFLIKIVGKGTASLAELKPGDKISAVLPLGNGFELIKKGKALLIGGGCGVAPLLYLARKLKTDNTIILGGKNKAEIVQVKEFKKYGKVKITTEDGSVGTKGIITTVLKDLSAYKMVYTCGPEAMLQGIAKMAKAQKVPLQVSLEAMMACGFGVCLSCVTLTKTGHRCVCTDGPVFKAEEIY